jgi:hypothetical protein
MSKSLITASRAVSKGDSHRDIILNHLEQAGSTVLTEIQKELLERWTFADEIIRRNVGFKKREAIAGMIMHRFDVCRATAYADIVNAEYVFSSSAPRNKKYLIGIRIDALEQNIMMATVERDWQSVAMLEKVMLGYIKEYPDYQPARSPKTIVFNVTQNNLMIGTNMTAEDAMHEAENALKELQDGTNI